MIIDIEWGKQTHTHKREGLEIISKISERKGTAFIPKDIQEWSQSILKRPWERLGFWLVFTK